MLSQLGFFLFDGFEKRFLAGDALFGLAAGTSMQYVSPPLFSGDDRSGPWDRVSPCVGTFSSNRFKEAFLV